MRGPCSINKAAVTGSNPSWRNRRFAPAGSVFARMLAAPARSVAAFSQPWLKSIGLMALSWPKASGSCFPCKRRSVRLSLRP